MRKVLLAIMGAGVISSVAAASLTNTLTINGWVEAACQSQLQNPQAMTFTFVGGGTPTYGTNALQVNCTTGTPYSVVLYSGNGATKPSAQTFAMLNPSLTDPAQYPIPYMVESGNTNVATGANIWSSVAQGSPIITATGVGAYQNYSFSIVPESASVSWPAGNYTDTLTFNTIY